MLLSAAEINLELKAISRKYPDITKLIFEGYSEGCCPIYSIRIGKGTGTLICTGGVHGRESINPSVLVKMTKEYCADYTKWMQGDKDGRGGGKAHSWDCPELLNQYQLLVLPLLNPDGYTMAVYEPTWKYNARGVDLNRNFPCRSYRKQNPQDRPLSEAESRILAGVFKREASIGYLDFHSRGREIYWYRSAMDIIYNQKAKKIAHSLCACSGYRIGTEEDEMQDRMSGGNTVQYYSEQFGLPAITVETVAQEAEFPLEEAWIGITWKEIRNIPLRYMRCWDSMKQSEGKGQ